jgi:hypothetical protein
MATKRAPQIPGEIPEDELDINPDAPDAEPVASGLPRAADIDPKTLSRAVLTADGWVCPG